MSMDFYSLIAHYWGTSRFEAKTRIITFRPKAYNSGATELDFLCQTQPDVLDLIHPDARAEVLAHWGMELGQN